MGTPFDDPVYLDSLTAVTVSRLFFGNSDGVRGEDSLADRLGNNAMRIPRLARPFVVIGNEEIVVFVVGTDTATLRVRWGGADVIAVVHTGEHIVIADRVATAGMPAGWFDFSVPLPRIGTELPTINQHDKKVDGDACLVPSGEGWHVHSNRAFLRRSCASGNVSGCVASVGKRRLFWH